MLHVHFVMCAPIQTVQNVSNVECELHSLLCPLSGIKMCNPVLISSHSNIGPFDKANVLSKIKGKIVLLQSTIKIFLCSYY